MVAGPPGLYMLEPLEPVRSQLRTLGARAEQLGIKDQFLARLREVVQHLTHDPVVWGDHTWTYPAAGLMEYHRLYEMLSLWYAVDPVHRIVYLKEIKPVLSHPLAQP